MPLDSVNEGLLRKDSSTPGEDQKPTKLSTRLKRLLPSSSSTSSRNQNYESVRQADRSASDTIDEGENSSNEDCWVDLPTTSKPSANNLLGVSSSVNSGLDSVTSRESSSPPQYSELPQASSINEDPGELKLEDLKWLPTFNESSESKKPRTPPPVSLALDRYTEDSELPEDNSFNTKVDDEDPNTRVNPQASNSQKSRAAGGSGLMELQMDPVQKKRNIDFHINFPSLPLDDILIEDWHCALQKDILVTGRLYVTQERICFHSNLFGWVNHSIIPFSDIVSVQKRSTAFVIPNAIQIITLDQKYFFTSFMSRDSAFTLLYELWYKKCPNRAIDPAKLNQSSIESKPEQPCCATSSEAGINTLCGCLKSSGHDGTINIDTTYPVAIESLFDVLFGEDTTFMMNHLSESNHDVVIGEWQGDGIRNISYVKPLSNPLGPKQTRCIITEKIQHKDFADYCTIEVRTQNPDVPSGDAFTVVSTHCIMRHCTDQCRLVTTTTIEWSKSSWFKGPIESGAKEGTTKAAQDLDVALRKYFDCHPELITEAVGSDTCVKEDNPLDNKLEKEIADQNLSSSSSKIQFWPPTPRGIMWAALALLIGFYIINWWRVSQLQSQITHHQQRQASPPRASRPVPPRHLAHLRELQANLRALGGQLEEIESRLQKIRTESPGV